MNIHTIHIFINSQTLIHIIFILSFNPILISIQQAKSPTRLELKTKAAYLKAPCLCLYNQTYSVRPKMICLFGNDCPLHRLQCRLCHGLPIQIPFVNWHIHMDIHGYPTFFLPMTYIGVGIQFVSSTFQSISTQLRKILQIYTKVREE